MRPLQLRLFNERRKELLKMVEEWETYHESDLKYRQAQKDRLAQVRKETGV